ncbi:MAG TPA: FtsQ-type POTRA domain-containing protein [Verrucomicrobiota bacterium]|nr:FtsQ-type POTRA domain-containing protein [Verrucomicrobiota bacterium]
MFRLPGMPRRNRRRDSDLALWVRLPAETPKGGRRAFRIRGWWIGLALLALVGVGSTWGVRVLQDRWLYRMERLALTHLVVRREGLLPEDELRRLSGIELGRNVLTVDLYQVRQRLLRHPRVEEAWVEIEFPDTLRITVRERVPVARIVLPQLGSAQAYYLVDDLGAVFLPFRRGEAPPDVLEAEAALPNLVGIGLTGIVSGSRFSDARVLAALKLLTTFERSPLITMADVVEVDVSDSSSLTLLTRGGSKITVANERDFDRQLTEWYSVHQFGLRQGLAISSLDLSVTNHPPLRWADPGTVVPEPVSRPRSTLRKPVRRHV